MAAIAVSGTRTLAPQVHLFVHLAMEKAETMGVVNLQVFFFSFFLEILHPSPTHYKKGRLQLISSSLQHHHLQQPRRYLIGGANVVAGVADPFGAVVACEAMVANASVDHLRVPLAFEGRSAALDAVRRKTDQPTQNGNTG